MTAKRGFAAMNPSDLSEIASLGGESVPAEKRAFSRDNALASSAGRMGGTSVPAEKRSFSRNRELASAAGRKGAAARVANAKARKEEIK